MIAIFCFLGLIVSGSTSPISVTADEREAFAQKLLNCVKEKRSRYSQATITYSGYVPKYSKNLIIGIYVAQHILRGLHYIVGMPF